MLKLFCERGYMQRVLVTGGAGFTGAILQASTSEVYGEPKIHPQPKTYWRNVNPIGIRSCYDGVKRYAKTFKNIYLQQI